MFKSDYFNFIMLIILVLHVIVINNVLPKNTYSRDVRGVLPYKLGNNPPNDRVYIEIKNGVINIYDSKLYTSATKIEYKIPIYNKKLLKTGDGGGGAGGDKYGLKLSREDIQDTTIFFDTIGEKEKWGTIITDFEPSNNYGKQSNGSVVLNDIQTEINKYLEKAKIQEKKIYNDTSSPKVVKEATADLLKLRGRMDDQIKKYENPKTLDNILKGETLDISDIVTCNCSISNLRTTLMYLSSIIPSIIVIVYMVRYFNKELIDNFIYKNIIGGVSGKEYASKFVELLSSSFMSIMYISVFILATCYHFYLLTKCRCAIPTQYQKGLSLFFMFLFPTLIILQISYKAFIE